MRWYFCGFRIASYKTKILTGFRPYLNNIDKTKRILEIGPLDKPMIKKSKSSNNVFYADIRATYEVKEFYRNNPNVDNHGICGID